RGELAAAIQEYERAIALRLKTPEVHPILLARARAALAETLVAASPRSPQARERAAREAAEAAALFKSEGDYGAAELADLESWRREVGLVDAAPTTATP
ncbi:MAG: hypothetical protein KC486_12255, partial [Myxococcales bacterium]|nr:hypothetical protein [Myxococcales bacterium]